MPKHDDGIRDASAFAARTYSKFRARKNSARTKPMGHVQDSRSMMPNSHQKLGTMTLASMIKM